MELVSYSAKSAAIRAARKALGAEAIPGTDFVVNEAAGRFSWSEKAPATPGADLPGLHEEPEAPKPVKKGFAGTPKTPKAPKAPREPQAEEAAATGARMSAKHKAALEAARRGELPEPPDFSADTHKRFRPKLEEAVKLATAGDLEGLEGFHINPISTSPKAIMRYRDLALVALKAQATA